MKKQTYAMDYCLVEKKMTAHKLLWRAELQGLKVKYFCQPLCGKCQRGLLATINRTSNHNIINLMA